MSGQLILLVEDSKKVQNYNKKMLERSGFTVEVALTLGSAKELLSRETPAAIILDVGMPDGSGLDFLREFRRTSKIPVLLLTGYSETKDIVKGFKRGCDDYLTKPYTFEVLLVRLRHLLEHAEQIPETITRGLLTLHLMPRKAVVNGTDLLLTPKDFAMLQFFVQNEERLLAAEYIYEKVWGQGIGEDSQALTNAVSRLRKKLCGCGYTISVEYGSGYRFERGETV
ncbi:MAG: response regulator transcription factor [Oscillospiraceae bacterium]|nr:response regulator transcription factor [Oscillospiraceae bacterium]